MNKLMKFVRTINKNTTPIFHDAINTKNDNVRPALTPKKQQRANKNLEPRLVRVNR
jgi:hypothetical protein